jgi:PAS domain S-box-containing protein
MSARPDSADPTTIAAILDSLDEGVLTLADDGTILDINRAACEMLEVEPAAVLDHTCMAVLGEQVCSQASRVRQSIADRCPIDGLEAEITTARGNHKVVQVRTRVLRERDGSARGGLILFRDLTALVRLRADLAGRYSLHDIIGKSKPMQAVFELIEQVADSDASVLLEGETGTGKELAARAIHALSARSAGPFVPVNCSALPESLLESELFGHVRGAFTGAQRDKAGRFERASGGTIFLDEIGEISPAIQVKLLRVLQERVIEPVGGEATRPVDLRVIAATNRDLQALVQEGTFRQDLYYRLRVIPITLPPLRARRDDVPLLVEHIIQRLRTQTGRPIERIDPDALAALLDYPWPGNVRELENVLEYAFVKARGASIAREHLPPELLGQPAIPPDAPSSRIAPPGPHRPTADRETIRATLRATGNNIARTARQLNMSRTTLYKRLREFGMTST